MKEKILALLTAKFSGMRKDGLAQLAGVLSLQATTDDEATELVEKITQEKADSFIKDFRKDVDKEVSEANKTFEGTLKKKYDFVEKKDPDPSKGQDPSKTDPADIASIIAAEIAKAVSPLQQKLAGFESEGVKKSRLQMIESKLNGVPDSFKAQKLKDFSRMNFDSEETFNEYLTEVETDITALTQELADKGLSGQSKPLFGSKNQDGTSSAVANFIASKSETNPLGGKEV
jgi:uncharacterized protein YdaT